LAAVVDVVTGAVAAGLAASLLPWLFVSDGAGDAVPWFAGLAAATAFVLVDEEEAVAAAAGAVVDWLPLALGVAVPAALVVAGFEAAGGAAFDDEDAVPLAAAGSAPAGAAFAVGGMSFAAAVTVPQGFGSTCAAAGALETSAAGVTVAALLPEARSAASADIGRDSSAIYEAKDEGSIIL
jgi:hypothetical protein